MEEDDTFRALRKYPKNDMFDAMAKLLPDDLWNPNGLHLLPSAILHLNSLGWTEKEFLRELIKYK